MPLHCSTLASKIPQTEEPGRLQSMGLRRVGHYWATSLSFSLSCIGEGNGSSLQCSCLENPRDGGAWWAAICGVTQSRTRLKRLSNNNNILTLTSELLRWLSGKESTCNSGDARDLIPEVRKIPRVGNGNSSLLAWKIPWTKEPGGLQSMGLQGLTYGWTQTHTQIQPYT